MQVPSLIPRSLPAPHAVQIWSAPVTLTEGERAQALLTLSTDELERAWRATPSVRELQVARRYWLRHVLAGYLTVPAASLQFRYGAFGKPRLAEGQSLHFNQTSSGDQTFIAVATTSIGIDAEHHDRQCEIDVRRWTAWEAITKAVGCGLGYEIALTISWDGHVPRISQIGHDDPTAWTLVSFCSKENVIVSVGVRFPQASWRLHSAYDVPGRTAHP